MSLPQNSVFNRGVWTVPTYFTYSTAEQNNKCFNLRYLYWNISISINFWTLNSYYWAKPKTAIHSFIYTSNTRLLFLLLLNISFFHFMIHAINCRCLTLHDKIFMYRWWSAKQKSKKRPRAISRHTTKILKQNIKKDDENSSRIAGIPDQTWTTPELKWISLSLNSPARHLHFLGVFLAH